jgi:zinc protease
MQSPDYVTDSELKTAAFRAEVDQARERETPSELAHIVSFWWASSGLDYYLGYVDHMRKVTPADVSRYMTAYTKDKPYVFGVMLSPELKKEKGLDAAHFEGLLGLKGGAR